MRVLQMAASHAADGRIDSAGARGIAASRRRAWIIVRKRGGKRRRKKCGPGEKGGPDAGLLNRPRVGVGAGRGKIGRLARGHERNQTPSSAFFLIALPGRE